MLFQHFCPTTLNELRKLQKKKKKKRSAGQNRTTENYSSLSKKRKGK